MASSYDLIPLKSNTIFISLSINLHSIKKRNVFIVLSRSIILKLTSFSELPPCFNLHQMLFLFFTPLLTFCCLTGLCPRFRCVFKLEPRLLALKLCVCTCARCFPRLFLQPARLSVADPTLTHFFIINPSL